MALSLRARVSLRFLSTQVRCMSQTGQWGEGAGKGGGTGGTIRDAGGAFGKREAAEEEYYFRKLQQEQLKKMRERSEDEIDYHAKQISQHKEAIDRHKKKIGQIKHDESEVKEKD